MSRRPLPRLWCPPVALGHAAAGSGRISIRSPWPLGLRSLYGSRVILEHEELTHDIIGAAIEVHRSLGPGFLEAIYSQAMGVELRRRGLPFEREIEAPVRYRGIKVGKHRLDLVIAASFIV